MSAELNDMITTMRDQWIGNDGIITVHIEKLNDFKIVPPEPLQSMIYSPLRSPSSNKFKGRRKKVPKRIGVKNSHNECNENSSSSAVEGNIAKRMKKSKSNIKKKRCSDISNNHHRLEDSLNIPALLMEEPKMKKNVSNSINSTTTKEFQIGNSHKKRRRTRGVKRILRTNDDTKLGTSNIKVASRKRIQQINVTSTMVGSENKPISQIKMFLMMLIIMKTMNALLTSIVIYRWTTKPNPC